MTSRAAAAAKSIVRAYPQAEVFRIVVNAFQQFGLVDRSIDAARSITLPPSFDTTMATLVE